MGLGRDALALRNVALHFAECQPTGMGSDGPVSSPDSSSECREVRHGSDSLVHEGEVVEPKLVVHLVLKLHEGLTSPVLRVPLDATDPAEALGNGLRGEVLADAVHVLACSSATVEPVHTREVRGRLTDPSLGIVERDADPEADLADVEGRDERVIRHGEAQDALVALLLPLGAEQVLVEVARVYLSRGDVGLLHLGGDARLGVEVRELLPGLVRLEGRVHDVLGTSSDARLDGGPGLVLLDLGRLVAVLAVV